MKLILKNSAINHKGYRIFKTTLLKQITMIFEREEENEFGPYAMVSHLSIQEKRSLILISKSVSCGRAVPHNYLPSILL